MQMCIIQAVAGNKLNNPNFIIIVPEKIGPKLWKNTWKKE